MADLRHPVTCAAAALLVLGGAAIAGAVTGWAAIPVIAGGLINTIGAEKLALLAGRGMDNWSVRYFNREAVLNHDLQMVFRAGLAAASIELERRWFQEHSFGIQQRRQGTDASAKALFADLRSNAALLFSDLWLDQVNEDLDILRRLQPSGSADDLLKPAIYRLAQGEDPQLAEFITEELPREVPYQFREQLKRTDQQGVRAKTAYDLLVFDQLLSNVEVIRAEIRQMHGDVGRLLSMWSEAVEQMRAERVALAARIEELLLQSEVRLTETVVQAGDRTADRVIGALNELFGADAADPTPTAGVAGRTSTDGRRPRIFEVPHRWNRYFVGRRDQLDRIAASFAARGGPAVLAQAIQGLGGVGKTQLAVRFAYERMADYDGVWWVSAESPTSLDASFKALEKRLELGLADNANPGTIAAAVRTYLEITEDTEERWLLVFDNAVPRWADNDSTGVLDPYLPRLGCCDVLITSRERDWQEIASPLDVDVLPLPEAVQFLLARSKQNDEETAQALAEDLGRLPLALEQAGAYVADKSKTGLMTLAAYREFFRQQPLTRMSLDRAKTGEYGEVVATTWIISYGEIEQRSQAATDLLKLFTFLAPEGIPLDDVVENANVLAEPLASALQQPAAAVEAVDLLLRFSLVESGGERMLNLHRLVQLIAREWLSDAEQNEWAAHAVAVISAALPQYDHRHLFEFGLWPTYARLLDHALAASQHAEVLNVAPIANIRLLDQLRQYLEDRVQFQDREDIQIRDDPPAATREMTRAVHIAEQAFGPEHPIVALRLMRLAELKFGWSPQGRNEERELWERALAILEKDSNADPAWIENILVNLSYLLREQVDLAGARERIEQVIAKSEQTHGPYHWSLASHLVSLGEVLWLEGDLAIAHTQYERALEIEERHEGSNRSEVLESFERLSHILRNLQEPDHATIVLEWALSINEARFGSESHRVVDSLVNLAGVLQDRGELVTAHEFLERALTILEKVVPPARAPAKETLEHLAQVLDARHDPGGGRTLYERALKRMHHEGARRLRLKFALMDAEIGDMFSAGTWLHRAYAPVNRAFDERQSDLEGLFESFWQRVGLLGNPQIALWLVTACFFQEVGIPTSEEDDWRFLMGLGESNGYDEAGLIRFIEEFAAEYIEKFDPSYIEEVDSNHSVPTALYQESHKPVPSMLSSIARTFATHAELSRSVLETKSAAPSYPSLLRREWMTEEGGLIVITKQ